MADGCSILAFTRIKGLYDATNATDVANVIVTLVSIVFVLFLQLKPLYIHLAGSRQAKRMYATYTSGIVSLSPVAMAYTAVSVAGVMCNGYLLVYHVLMQNATSDTMGTVISAVFGTLFWASILLTIQWRPDTSQTPKMPTTPLQTKLRTMQKWDFASFRNSVICDA